MTRSHTIRITLLLLASVGDLPGDIHAAEPESGWSVDVPLDLTANSFFVSNGHSSAMFESIAIETGIELSPYRAHWSTGVFVEHHLTHASEFFDLTILGLFATWRTGAWKTTSAMMLTRTRGTNGRWQHMTRLKRRLTDHQDLVVMAVVPVDDPARTSIVLGWKASLGTHLTLDLAAGAAVADPQRQLFQLALKWQLH